MRSNRSRGAQRFAALAVTALAFASLTAGCNNKGGIGDGVTDNGDTPIPTSGSSSVAGQSGSIAGALSSMAGSSGLGGSAGASGGGAGLGGGSGLGGGGGAAGMSGGAGGAAGSGGKAGSGGVGGTSGSSGMSGGGGSAGAPACMSQTCGNGTVEGCEACDTSTDTANYGAACSTDCAYKVSTQACIDCETAGDCVASQLNCIDPQFTDQQKALCFALLHCIEASNCMDGTGPTNGAGKCYCGTLTTAACSAAPFDLTKTGAPSGACATLIQAGMPDLSSNATVLGNLTANKRPAGAAMQRLNCQKVANNAACYDICGFTPSGPTFP